MEACTRRNRFFGYPSLKEVLLEDVSLLGQALLGAIGEYYADSLDTHANHFLGEIKIEVLARNLGDALPAVDWGPDLWVILDNDGREPLSRAL